MKINKEYTPVITKIRKASHANLPKGSHIYLYGSRARGDAQEGSDWDLLVLLDKPAIEQKDYDGICYDLTSLGWDLGEMIIPVLYTKEEWNRNAYTPFYTNVESEGIEII